MTATDPTVAFPLWAAIIRARTSLPPDFLIVAREPFYLGADAAYVELDGSRMPTAAREAGFSPFLDRHDLEKLLEDCDRKVMSDFSRAEYVIYYAVNDAYPHWYDDLVDS